MNLRQIIYALYVEFTLQMSVDRSKKRNIDTTREYLYLVPYINSLHDLGKINEAVDALTVGTGFMELYRETGDNTMADTIEDAIEAGHYDQWPVVQSLG